VEEEGVFGMEDREENAGNGGNAGKRLGVFEMMLANT
jgi:hypothetical protein